MLYLFGGDGGNLSTNGLGPCGDLYRDVSEDGTIRGKETRALRQVVPKDWAKTDVEAWRRDGSLEWVDEGLLLDVDGGRGEMSRRGVRGGVGGGSSSA
jgi:hypothetical protein